MDVQHTDDGVVITGVQAILFDMDGTLIDSTPAVERSWRSWGVDHGFAPDFRDHLPGGTHGRPAVDLVATVLPADAVADGVADILRRELEDTEDVTVLPGAAALLAAIPAGRSAIVTSCAGPLASVRIAAGGLEAPDLVVTADDITRGKPDPEPFLLAAERLGVDPARCIVVEDAPAGLAAGRAAGCITIAVTGTHRRDELDAALVVDSLEALSVIATDEGLVLTARA